ncbi:MAG: hypothetical protein ABIF08_04030 [Nanoarchaeota archaeon]
MVFDWLVLKIPGWSRKVRRLRRNWDRAREEALTKKKQVRMMLLEKLDRIEMNLRLLEEQKLGIMQKKKTAREIELGLVEVKIILKTKEEDIINENSNIEMIKQEKYKKSDF